MSKQSTMNMMKKYLNLAVLSVKECIVVVLSLAEIQRRFMLRFILSGGLDLGLTPLGLDAYDFKI